MSCGATTSTSTSMAVPLGYRFRPTDQELLKYLKTKIENLPLPCDIIKEVELYKFDPSELLAQFGSSGEDKCYFFTSTHRKYPNGCRPSRSTKNGFWKASTGATEIKDERNNLIGTMRSLVFYDGEHPGKKTNWIMHEYKLSEHLTVNQEQILIDPMKLDECVLCSIYENLSARETRKRKATVVWEGLDTSSNEREIVLQRVPLNGHRDIFLQQGTLNGNQDIFLQRGHLQGIQDVFLQQGPLNGNQDIFLQEGPLNGYQDPFLLQGPLSGNQENNQSTFPLFDNLSQELILANASDMGCNIAPPCDTDQNMVLPFDNLLEEPVPNASDIGCDIAPSSDTDLALIAEQIMMLDCDYPWTSSS